MQRESARERERERWTRMAISSRDWNHR